MSKKKQFEDIKIPINQLADEVNNCLNKNQEDKYFQNIVLLYSFQENILRWLIFIQMCWSKSDMRKKNKGQIEDDAFEAMKTYCRGLTFYQAESLALSIDLIDLKLYRSIQYCRKQRNDVLHDLWLFEHRNDKGHLRKELEFLASVTNDLMTVFNKLTKKIGVNEVYGMML